MRPADKKKFKKVAEVNAELLECKVTDKVKEGQEYYFRIYAENDIGISEDGAELDSPVKVPAKNEKQPAEEVVQAEDVVDARVEPVKGLPEIIEAPEAVSVSEGEPIRLTCKVKGKSFSSIGCVVLNVDTFVQWLFPIVVDPICPFYSYVPCWRNKELSKDLFNSLFLLCHVLSHASHVCFTVRHV